MKLTTLESLEQQESFYGHPLFNVFKRINFLMYATQEKKEKYQHNIWIQIEAINFHGHRQHRVKFTYCSWSLLLEIPFPHPGILFLEIIKLNRLLKSKSRVIVGINVILLLMMTFDISIKIVCYSSVYMKPKSHLH